MSQLVLTQRTFNRRLGNQSNMPLTLRVGKFFLFFALTFLIGLVSFTYLVKFTHIHTKGYELRRLEVERDQLLGEREKQRKQIESLKALQTIRDNSVAQGLVAPRQITFVKSETNVASR